MIDVSSAVTTVLSDSTAIIRFNRPTERNPLSVATLDQLRAEFSTLTARNDVHAIIFTGTDDVFSSGANIRELTKLDSQSAERFAKFGQDLFQLIANARQVTIAAINGYCMGGALDLTLACDVRVASRDAVFGHPGAQLGIITGWGGTQRLPRLVGQARALEILLTARRLTSQEALDIGLVTGLSDPVLDYALQVARGCQEKGAELKSGAWDLT